MASGGGSRAGPAFTVALAACAARASARCATVRCSRLLALLEILQLRCELDRRRLDNRGLGSSSRSSSSRHTATRRWFLAHGGGRTRTCPGGLLLRLAALVELDELILADGHGRY